MRPLLGVPLLLVLAACGDEGGDFCAERFETYHVRATLSLREPGKRAGDGSGDETSAARVSHGKLLATVLEDRSIISCKGDLVSEVSHPGHVLDEAIELHEPSFSLDVSASHYPAVHVPALWLRLQLDENDNGACDEGEPAALVPLARSEQASTHDVALNIELIPSACPLPSI
jgi:hypothetical protein